MKKIILVTMLLVSSVFYAQKNGITYQAVILNPKGEKLPGVNNENIPLANKQICLQFTIFDAASQNQYQETIQTTTDEFGMVNLVIGSGHQSGGYASSFDKIVWSAPSLMSLKVALDLNVLCGSYEEISNQHFSSVPFSFTAAKAENVTGLIAIENGGTNATTIVGAKTNLGLKNVDNTSDLNKPISIETLTALELKESTTNKSLDVALDAASNTKYPSVKAVKTYIDNQAVTGIRDGSITTIKLADGSATDEKIAFGISATKVGLGNVNNTSDLNKPLSIANLTALDLKESTSNKSLDVAIDAASNTKYPSVKAVKTYVDANASTGSTALTAEVTRATNVENALFTNLATETNNRLTADATFTNNLSLELSRAIGVENTKEVLTNKSGNVPADGTSDTKYPSVKAVKTYVDAKLATVSGANLTYTNSPTQGVVFSDTGTSATIPAGSTVDASLMLPADKIKLNTISGTNTGDQINISGNAATASRATQLNTARTINGVSFDGTANITIPATSDATKQDLDAELTAVAGLNTNGIIAKTATGTVTTRTITGTSDIPVTSGDGIFANPSIALSDTAVTPGTYTGANITVDAKGRITAATNGTSGSAVADATTLATGKIQLAGDLGGSATSPTVLKVGGVTPTAANTANSIVLRDASGNFVAGTMTGNVTGNISGNAGTATALQTGRTISTTGDLAYTSSFFDGSANVSAPATIAAGAVTYAKLQNVSTNNRLLGRATAGAGSAEEITLGTGLSFTGTTLNASASGGTVTSASVVTANGITGSVATASTTPAITLTLGAITPTSVNSVVISGSATPALSVTGTASISNANGSNTGDNATNTQYSGLVTNATHTGDVTDTSGVLKVTKINNVALSSLSTGILKNTTVAGTPSIAIAGTDYALPNANTTGTAANVTGTVLIANGGTGATTATLGLNNLLPTQTGNSGLILSTNGTNAAWSAAGAGTVTGVTVTPSNGVTSSVTGTASVPTINLGLGAITPTSVNSVVISGSASPTLSVTGTASISNVNGSNTGDNAPNTLYNTLVTNATHTGDVTDASGVLKVTKINNVALSSLSTGILKNTTGVGTPSIALPGTDYALPNANTTGNAATTTAFQTGRTISTTGDVAYTSPVFDGSANVSAAATIAAGAVTYAKLQNVSTNNKLLGRATAGAGTAEEITLGTGLSFTGTVLNASASGGTLTGVTVTPSNGVTSSVTGTAAVPILNLGLGAITPTSVNSVVISGAATPTLSVTGTASISNINGSNTGDNAPNTLYNTLVTNATHTGDVTDASGVLKVTKINNVALSSLTTGILKNTTGVGTPSIALAGTDYALPNANTTGTAANVTGTVLITNGGTGATTATLGLNNLLPTQTSNIGKILQTDGSNATWAAPAATNLGYTASATNGMVTSSNGTSATVPAGSTTNASLMLPADKTKLNKITDITGVADANKVLSVKADGTAATWVTPSGGALQRYHPTESAIPVNAITVEATGTGITVQTLQPGTTIAAIPASSGKNNLIIFTVPAGVSLSSIQIFGDNNLVGYASGVAQTFYINIVYGDTSINNNNADARIPSSFAVYDINASNSYQMKMFPTSGATVIAIANPVANNTLKVAVTPNSLTWAFSMRF